LDCNKLLYFSLSLGFCGFWGCLCVGIFGSDENAAFAGYPGSAAGHHPFQTGDQFAVQLVGAICIGLWTIGIAFVMFTTIKYTIGFRVSEECENTGLDLHEHGESTYIFDEYAPSAKVTELIATKGNHNSGTSQHITPTASNTDDVAV
jgi:ammonia channel protein AmtB